jgi:hypothetical protein
MSLCYFPSNSSTTRVCWYGGESTHLHYEELIQLDRFFPKWIAINCKTLGNGVPSQVKELYQEMVDFYNESQ